MRGKENGIGPEVGSSVTDSIKNTVFSIREAPAAILLWSRRLLFRDNIDIGLVLEDISNISTRVLVS